MTPQILTLLGVVLGVVGISAPTAATIKLIAAAAIPVLIGVYQWQHHRTIRNADNAAAAAVAAKARIAEATAQALTAKAQLAATSGTALASQQTSPTGPLGVPDDAGATVR